MLLIALFLIFFAAASAVLLSLHPSRAVVRLRGTVVGFLLALGLLAAGANLLFGPAGMNGPSQGQARTR